MIQQTNICSETEQKAIKNRKRDYTVDFSIFQAKNMRLRAIVGEIIGSRPCSLKCKGRGITSLPPSSAKVQEQCVGLQIQSHCEMGNNLVKFLPNIWFLWSIQHLKIPITVFFSFSFFFKRRKRSEKPLTKNVLCFLHRVYTNFFQHELSKSKIVK